MNAQPRRIPTYNLHRPSGLARVRLNGRDLYLGPHGTPESHAEYDRVIGEWLASGGSDHGIDSRRRSRFNDSITITELIAAYWKHRLVWRGAVHPGADRPARPAPAPQDVRAHPCDRLPRPLAACLPAGHGR